MDDKACYGQDLADDVSLNLCHVLGEKLVCLDIAGTQIPLSAKQFRWEDAQRQLDNDDPGALRETLAQAAYEKVASYNATAPGLSFESTGGLVREIESQLPEDQRPTTKRTENLPGSEADKRLQSLIGNYAKWVVLGELADYTSDVYGGDLTQVGAFYLAVSRIANHTAGEIKERITEELDEEERKNSQVIDISLETAIKSARKTFK